MGSLIVVMAGFVLLNIEPLQVAIQRNHDDIIRTEEQADSAAERIARNEGAVEQLQRQVEQIDRFGSRKWNNGERREK